MVLINSIRQMHEQQLPTHEENLKNIETKEAHSYSLTYMLYKNDNQ